MVNSRLMRSLVVNFPLIGVNGLCGPVGEASPVPHRNETRGALASLLAVWLVLAAAGCGAAGAQPGGAEIVPPADRNVTPPGILPGPEVDGPLVREPVPVPAADPARWHRFFLPATNDAATFATQGLTIRISGVAPPGVDMSCVLSDGSRWPCGRTARHALRMFLRGRAVECFFPYSLEVADIVAPCRVGRTDLGLWLLAQGWAEAGELATDDYREAEHAARCAGAGIWRGQPLEDCG